jgi:hypothetical protein
MWAQTDRAVRLVFEVVVLMNCSAEVLVRAAKATVELACEDGYLGVLLQSCLDSASQYAD